MGKSEKLKDILINMYYYNNINKIDESFIDNIIKFSKYSYEAIEAVAKIITIEKENE